MNDKKMPRVIHILGASGTGVTTLGEAVSKRWGYTPLDTDDYFWLPSQPPFTVKRPPAHRLKLLRAAIDQHKPCVVSGSLCGWGDNLIPLFDLVVFLTLPPDIRMERLYTREQRHHGPRILPGGDMHKAHMDFIAWAARYDTAGPEQRSLQLHRQWLEKLPCPVVEIESCAPVEQLLEALAPHLCEEKGASTF